MALSIENVIQTTPELVAALDTVLATIPADGIIRAISFDVQVAAKRTNPKAAVSLMLDSSGGTTLTEPWVSHYFQAASAADLTTKIEAFIATFAGYITNPIVKYRVNDNGDFDQLYALVLTNEDANAGDNYLPVGALK